MVYIVALITVLIDQLSKWLIVKNMFIGESIPVIGDFFILTSHRNRGAAWGMLEGQFGLFYIATIVVVIALLYYIKSQKITDWMNLLAIGMIIGGALGNFFDRVFRKEVVDFFEVNIGSYNSFPIFNVADVALTIGVLLFVLATLFESNQERK